MATATIKEIRETAKEAMPMEGCPNCFAIKPPVILRRKTFFEDEKISHCDAIDEGGKNPNSVHLIEDGYWWEVKKFTIAYETSNKMGDFVEALLKETTILEAKCWLENIEKKLRRWQTWNSFMNESVSSRTIKEACDVFSSHIAANLKGLLKLGLDGLQGYTELYENSHAFLREVWEKARKQGFQINLKEIDRINNY